MGGGPPLVVEGARRAALVRIHYGYVRSKHCPNKTKARHPEHHRALTVTIGKSAKDLIDVGSLN